MASTASSEFSLVGRSSLSPVPVRTPGAHSIQASASFRHHGVEVRANGGNKKPRIVSAIAQQQTLNEDEEVFSG